jgi:hypothetical protein
MRFNFRLRGMRDISPWPGVGGAHPHLGWFGLTDGWYWIEAGSADLFRYSQPLVDRWTREHGGASWLEALPYVDYQVARLWEDVLDILPDVLDPVPPRLARALAPDGPWSAWERAARAAVEQAPPEQEEEAWDLLEAAARWWWDRTLDAGYLQAAPRIWLWSDGAEVSVQWDNRGRILDGLPAWAAVIGQHTVPAATFVAEVRSFDARFISRMRDRVAIAQAEWARPDVALDPDLDQEQLARSGHLSRRLGAVANAKPEPERWDAVLRAIASVEALPGFAPEQKLRLS